jgi:hypothetical protein
MEEPEAKCVWLMFAQGREIVGPCYSERMQNDDGRRVEGTEEEKNSSTRHVVGTAHPESGNKRTRDAMMELNLARSEHKRIPEPHWCPVGLTKMQLRRLQKMRQREITEKRKEEEHDVWFTQTWPMFVMKKMWREKRLAREEDSNEGPGADSSQEGVGARSNIAEPETKLGNREEEATGVQAMEVNMVFMLPEEFHAPGTEVVMMVEGEERAVFERPVKLGEHMKLLYIKGHLDGKPVGWMMVDGDTSVNIMPLTTFQRLGQQDDELKQMNMSLTGFLGEPPEARGIVS